MTPAHAPEIAEQRAGGAVVAGAGDPARAEQEIAHGGPLLAWRGWPAADRRTYRCSTADRPLPPDRKSVGSGKSVAVRVDLGGRRIIQKKNNITRQHRKITIKIRIHRTQLIQ